MHFITNSTKKHVHDAVNGTTHFSMLLGCAIGIISHFLFGLVRQMLRVINNLLVIWNENIKKSRSGTKDANENDDILNFIFK